MASVYSSSITVPHSLQWGRGAMRVNAYLYCRTCVAVAWDLDQLVERCIA
jgi:hypothetical protein